MSKNASATNEAELTPMRKLSAKIGRTGYTPEAASLISLVEKGAAILQKPYSLTSLSQMVRGALEHQPRV